MIDGARMASPGLVAGMCHALAAPGPAIVAVPGYHLGDALQQEAAARGYTADVEAELLRSINWRGDGYRLFDRSVLSATSGSGFLMPISESNCLAMHRRLMKRLGGCDIRFQSPGGGYVNLDLYRRACDLPATTLYLLAGEGTFHQFHSGATTDARPDRDLLMDQLRAEYELIRGRPFAPPDKQAALLGTISPQAARFMEFSAQQVRARSSL